MQKRPPQTQQLTDGAHVVLGLVAKYSGGVHPYRLYKEHFGDIFTRQSRACKLYRVLESLRKRSLVSCIKGVAGNKLRIVYTVTPDGHARFQEWLTSFPEQPNAIVEKLLMVLAFEEHLPPGILQSYVNRAVAVIEKSLAELQRDQVKNQTSSNPLYLLALIARKESDLALLLTIKGKLAPFPAEAISA